MYNKQNEAVLFGGSLYYQKKVLRGEIMIYITGDTHGVYNDLMYRIEKYSLGEDDILIVCGDFGFVKREDEYNYCLDKLSRLPFTIAFADGNHENFDLIEVQY